jgi:hypothetical protein
MAQTGRQAFTGRTGTVKLHAFGQKRVQLGKHVIALDHLEKAAQRVALPEFHLVAEEPERIRSDHHIVLLEGAVKLEDNGIHTF